MELKGLRNVYHVSTDFQNGGRRGRWGEEREVGGGDRGRWGEERVYTHLHNHNLFSYLPLLNIFSFLIKRLCPFLE